MDSASIFAELAKRELPSDVTKEDVGRAIDEIAHSAEAGMALSEGGVLPGPPIHEVSLIRKALDFLERNQSKTGSSK